MVSCRNGWKVAPKYRKVDLAKPCNCLGRREIGGNGGQVGVFATASCALTWLWTGEVDPWQWEIDVEGQVQVRASSRLRGALISFGRGELDVEVGEGRGLGLEFWRIRSRRRGPRRGRTRRNSGKPGVFQDRREVSELVELAETGRGRCTQRGGRLLLDLGSTRRTERGLDRLGCGQIRKRIVLRKVARFLDGTWLRWHASRANPHHRRFGGWTRGPRRYRWSRRRAGDRVWLGDDERVPTLRASHLQARGWHPPFVDLVGRFARLALDLQHRVEEGYHN
jgi:hypothetical protein